MTLHPDFPVVAGDCQLTEDWALTLPVEMNRRLEDQDLVFWRPGFTVWLSLWNNDHDASIEERLEWFQTDTSAEAFDAVVTADATLARYTYRLNEARDEDLVYALYGFVLKDAGHLQIAVYADDEGEVAAANLLVASVR